MEIPIDIVESGEYIEPHTFESDREAKLFYAYLEDRKYIESVQNKAIQLIKKIRKKEDEAWKQGSFCREHNFLLEAEKFRAIEDSLRNVCLLLENEFETGYVSIE